ncbi:O-methyltransferase [Blastococcus saxobsidens]|uniref:Caffeoyl-CoA O-methyltransferase n=1 Tax=Blastococcus saxobsidens (strain DD2) TaxID=1146883 RepID=H6RL66_BLASD|nr:O-methyltransferase [Blastococcus saxobsidens]CCG01196.1 Caffeoyl-CoA O-methyltransferase [Blastococcus saxobsidens DD2]
MTEAHDRSLRISPTPEVVDYVLTHSLPAHPAQAALAARTRRQYGGLARMQIAPEQGGLLTVLVRLVRATHAVEVGTFTGYSSISIARGLEPGGRLLCLDISERATDIAREAWQEAGLADRVDLRLGPAADTLRALPPDEQFDFCFVDADKAGYPGYLDELLPRTRAGGLLAFDNVLLGGEVLDPRSQGDAAVMRAFNDQLAADPRVDVAMIPVADGLTLAVKR